MSVSALPLGNVAVSDYIVAIVDGPITSKVFADVTYTASTSAGPTLGSTAFSAAVPTGVTGFPTVASLTAVEATDPVSGDIEVGQFRVTLTPNAADTVNAASPMNYTFSSNAWAITASTSSG